MRKLITLLGTVALGVIGCSKQSETLETLVAQEEEKTDKPLTVVGQIFSGSTNDELCNSERFDVKIEGNKEIESISGLATYNGNPMISVCSTIDLEAFEERDSGWFGDKFFQNRYSFVAVPKISNGNQVMAPYIYEQDPTLLLEIPLYDLVSMTDTFDYPSQLDLSGVITGYAIGTDERSKCCGIAAEVMYQFKPDSVDKTYVVCAKGKGWMESKTNFRVVADRIGANDTGRAVYRASVFEKIE